MKIRVALVDDHQLFLKSLSLMLETLQDFEVVAEALHGKDLLIKLAALKDPPDLALIDVNMPVMDGMETTIALQRQYPAIKLVALSMNDGDSAVIKMFKAGCCAYLLKDVHPAVLGKALHQVHTEGYCNSELLHFNPGKLLNKSEKQLSLHLTPKEQQFLQFACSELTYKQIAAEMHVAERTVDGYREALFQKFAVQSRVGLCLEALRKELVHL